MDSAIDDALKDAEDRFESAVALLVTAPRVGEVSAKAVLAEIGTNMNQFPTADHLSSWAGICSGNKQSGGKRLSSKTTPGNKWLKTTLVQMAGSASHQRGTYLHALYTRIAARRGKKRAIVAVAHSLLVSFFQMLKNGIPYQELGKEHLDRLNQTKTLDRLTSRIAGLGYKVLLEPIPA